MEESAGPLSTLWLEQINYFFFFFNPNWKHCAAREIQLQELP